MRPHVRNIPHFWRVILCLGLLAAACGASGCGALVSSAAGDLADGLSKSIIDNDDLATVEDGGPAYLLLIDGLL